MSRFSRLVMWLVPFLGRQSYTLMSVLLVLYHIYDITFVYSGDGFHPVHNLRFGRFL